MVSQSPLLFLEVMGAPFPENFDVGNKKDNITVIYTPWSNLKKDGSMAVGQVGFKDQRKVCTRFPHPRSNY